MTSRKIRFYFKKWLLLVLFSPFSIGSSTLQTTLITSPGFKTDFTTFINFGIQPEVGYSFPEYSVTCIEASHVLCILWSTWKIVAWWLPYVYSSHPHQFRSLDSVPIANLRSIADPIFCLRKVLTDSMFSRTTFSCENASNNMWPPEHWEFLDTLRAAALEGTPAGCGTTADTAANSVVTLITTAYEATVRRRALICGKSSIYSLRTPKQPKGDMITPVYR